MLMRAGAALTYIVCVTVGKIVEVWTIREKSKERPIQPEAPNATFTTLQ
jgi:hypothetical protein